MIGLGRMGANMVLEVCGLHCGANAAGHFVKMVYDGIEHGIMAAFAEDMSHANVGEPQHAVDAETTPLHNREPYRHDLDLPHIAELWRRGSVIASWLPDLTADMLAKDPALTNVVVKVSGEAGRSRTRSTRPSGCQCFRPRSMSDSARAAKRLLATS
jgi:6-phosphogluconate dehydrogenase